MTKKTLKKKVQPKAAADKYAAPVLDSAREIWLAGLGAFAVAQQESGKLIEQGNKLFEKLVSEGNKLEKQTRNVAEEAVGGFRGGVESKVENVRQTAVITGTSWKVFLKIAYPAYSAAWACRPQTTFISCLHGYKNYPGKYPA